MFFARRARLAAGIVRAEPCGEPERLFRCAEMLVKPARPAGRRRYHADRLVIDALDLVPLAVLPRRKPEMLWPGIGVALVLDADQHRRRSVRVRFGIVPVLVLTDPKIKCIAGHERLDATPARRAAVIERQIAIDDVGDEIGPPHRQAAHRVWLDVVLVSVKILGARKPVAE